MARPLQERGLVLTPARQMILRKAAELLELDATELRAAHTIDGRWQLKDAADRVAFEDHGRRTTLAQALRRIAEEG